LLYIIFSLTEENMSAQTMYEKIMSLPLFKGVGVDHVSSFLEKTSISFSKFSPGESIMRRGEEVRSLKFVLSGVISVATPSQMGKIITESEISKDIVIGVNRLFGINISMESDIRAIDEVSIMEFSKEKYLALLKTDSIYLINYANTLSLQGQTIIDLLRNVTENSLAGILTKLLVLYSYRNSENVKISPLDELKSIYAHLNVEKEIGNLASKGWIEVKGNMVIVPDRKSFIENVLNEI